MDSFLLFGEARPVGNCFLHLAGGDCNQSDVSATVYDVKVCSIHVVHAEVRLCIVQLSCVCLWTNGKKTTDKDGTMLVCKVHHVFCCFRIGLLCAFCTQYHKHHANDADELERHGLFEKSKANLAKLMVLNPEPVCGITSMSKNPINGVETSVRDVAVST